MTDSEEKSTAPLTLDLLVIRHHSTTVLQQLTKQGILMYYVGLVFPSPNEVHCTFLQVLFMIVVGKVQMH